jgi:hypothetical protein
MFFEILQAHFHAWLATIVYIILQSLIILQKQGKQKITWKQASTIATGITSYLFLKVIYFYVM